MKTTADLILHNGHITTLDPKYSEATNVAIKDGRIVGVDDAESYERHQNTKVIDLKGATLLPALLVVKTEPCMGSSARVFSIKRSSVP